MRFFWLALARRDRFSSTVGQVGLFGQAGQVGQAGVDRAGTVGRAVGCQLTNNDAVLCRCHLPPQFPPCPPTLVVHFLFSTATGQATAHLTPRRHPMLLLLLLDPFHASALLPSHTLPPSPLRQCAVKCAYGCHDAHNIVINISFAMCRARHGRAEQGRAG